MAVFNSGFPATYQPMYYAPQYQPVQYQQPQPVSQQQQTAPTPPPQVTNSIIWVQGEAGAKSHLVAPNTTVPLWDSEAQRIFLKSADAAGMPTMKILNYSIEETPSIGSPAQRAVNAAISVPSPEAREYAGKAEQEALRAEMEAYKRDIETLRADLESFRGDLYGIAGKKPAARKKEAASDE